MFAVEVSSRVKDSFDKEGMLVEQTFDCKQMLVDAITCTKKFG